MVELTLRGEQREIIALLHELAGDAVPAERAKAPTAEDEREDFPARMAAAQSMEQGIENILAFSVGGKTGLQTEQEA